MQRLVAGSDWLTLQRFGVGMSCCGCSFAEYPSFDNKHSDVDIPAVALTKGGFSFCRRRMDLALRTWQQHVNSFCLPLQLPDRAAHAGLSETSDLLEFLFSFPNQHGQY